MSWWAWFLAGALAMHLFDRFLLGWARGKMGWSKTLRRDFFGKMKYASLLRVKEALDAELAERERPMV